MEKQKTGYLSSFLQLLGPFLLAFQRYRRVKALESRFDQYFQSKQADSSQNFMFLSFLSRFVGQIFGLACRIEEIVFWSVQLVFLKAARAVRILVFEYASVLDLVKKRTLIAKDLKTIKLPRPKVLITSQNATNNRTRTMIKPKI